MNKTIVELFAGVGGFRLGFEASGDWKTLWFSQWEPGRKAQWAHDCYVQHFGDLKDKNGEYHTGEDICGVDKETIPEHSLLVGGFPCQDYSISKPLALSQGIEGSKGVLFWQIRDILQQKKTPFVLLENVDRLLKSPSGQRGRDMGLILWSLAKLGYSAEYRVINGADYGCPQRRRRVFLFAWRDDTRYGREISSIASAPAIITESGFFASAFPADKDISILHTSLPQDPEAAAESFQFDFQNAGYMTGGEIYSARLTPVLEEPVPLSRILEKNVPEKYYLPENKLERFSYLKGAKKLQRTSKNGHSYVYSEGAVPFPDPIDKPARTLLTGEGSLSRSTHVICDPETNRLRLLTPLETERIQGFPDNWTVSMPERNRYFCMGNALLVPLVSRMAKILEDIVDRE